MMGQWKLRCGWIGHVKELLGTTLYGYIECEHPAAMTMIQIPTYWGASGNSECRELDLMEKI